MTKNEAAQMRVQWNQRKPGAKCEHVSLELEMTASGYVIGNYNCIVCGQPVVQGAGKA